MLVIRSAQLAVLTRTTDAPAEDRALTHLRACIPEVCSTLSEAKLRRIIRWGRERSRRYGIEREYDFFRYLNLMFMFGFAFDTDARFPWAQRALADRRKPAAARVDLLMDFAILACSAATGARVV